MHTNRLIHEKSPYLLQHAHNPVDWYAWGPDAFEKAKREDKPIFLSIGYSTCHWCHVMERESFESEEIAELLNRYYVPVKVDREERPDVDRIYMMFVQATTGGGGWPMSVWLTPDLQPFYGGTYFPPDSRYGRPGFASILQQIANTWTTERERVIESGADVLRQLLTHARVSGGANWLDNRIVESCFYGFRRSFDSRLGGFGGAPKFPRPVIHNFLLRYWLATGNEEAVDMVHTTLRAMAKGGMNDQLGGGFHRYSVDSRWFVPHFEKMLYDEAQLAISYVETYQVRREETLAATARTIFNYVLRDLTHPEGAFYSAEDADSIIDPENPHEKGEGAFYIWSWQELQGALESPAAEWFAARYGVEAGGNVREDPHGEFTGKNILFEARSIDDIAKQAEVDATEVSVALEQARLKLLEIRSKRPRPHLDDKILTAWNGLMISAFAIGGRVLREPRYIEGARRASDFIVRRMYRDGTLLRRFRDGEAAISGFLDDYAFFANALADLYETTFEFRDLATAVALAEKMIDLFEDKENGGFYSTAAGDESLVMRLKDDYDGAEPSGNSVAILLLLRLAQMTGRVEFRESAERALAAFGPRLSSMPVGMPQMVAAFMFSQAKPQQTILGGERDQMQPFIEAAHQKFQPNRILLLANQETRARLSDRLPILAETKPGFAYVCENFTCQLPVARVGEFVELLK